jgi:hypothetical protein
MAMLHSRATLLQNSRWSSSVTEFRLLSHNQWQWWVNNSKLDVYVTFLEFSEQQKRYSKNLYYSFENYMEFTTLELWHLDGSGQLFFRVLLSSHGQARP